MPHKTPWLGGSDLGRQAGTLKPRNYPMINDGDMSVMCQVCRSGMVQHLQHLLLYGADRNARNASGNTPLHVCAVNNKVSPDLD